MKKFLSVMLIVMLVFTSMSVAMAAKQPVDPATVNYALKADVDFSSSIFMASGIVEQPGYGWYYEYVHDGHREPYMVQGWNPVNGWHSEGALDQEWLTFDLGSVKTIGKVVLVGRNDGQPADQTYFPQAFEIQVSKNGTDWQTVYTKDYGTDKPFRPTTAQVYEFANVMAKHVKINVTRQDVNNDGNHHVAFAEVEIYKGRGENYALNAEVDMSSSIDEGSGYEWLYNYINDGNRDQIVQDGWRLVTGWHSTGDNDKEWIQYDLGAIKKVNEVVLYPRSDRAGTAETNFPQAISVQVSRDGKLWKTVLVKDFTVGLDGKPYIPEIKAHEFKFNKEYVRYVKLNITQKYKNDKGENFAALGEFEVYGD